MLAFYSLIRHVADLDRREPVNVGLLVGIGTDVDIRVVDRPEVPDPDVVCRFKGLLEHLLAEGGSASEGAADDAETVLRSLADRRFSQFEVTEPRTVSGEDDLTRLADSLAQRLVRDEVTV